MVNSRTKGHSFERKIASLLRPIWENARRGIQYRDGADAADVINTEPFFIECKCGKRIDIDAAMEQAQEASKGTGLTPIVISHKDRRQTLVTMTLESFVAMVEKTEAFERAAIKHKRTLSILMHEKEASDE